MNSEQYNSIRNKSIAENNTASVALTQQYIRALDGIIKSTGLKTGNSVSWNNSGGTARGKITKIVDDGEVAVPGSSFNITGTAEDPAALIKLYCPDALGKYKSTDIMVGHKTSTLTKIAALD